MSSDRWTERCKRCGCSFEVGLWTQQRDYCDICQIELDSDPNSAPEMGVFTVGDKLPKPSDWPDVDPSAPQESEVEKQQRYTQEDHEWMMRHPYWGKHPGDRD